MTIEELENKVKELQEEVEKMKEQKKSGRWKPQEGDKYYFHESGGAINNDTWVGDANVVDNNRWLMGNCFATRGDVGFEIDRLKVLAEMREFEESPDREWDCRNFHYYIFYNTRTNNIVINSMTIGKDYNIFFESEEKAEECILKVGANRIRKFYCRVEDK